jgi:hypothetical protein
VRLAEAIRPARAQRLLDLARELLTALGPAALEPAALHLSVHLLLWYAMSLEGMTEKGGEGGGGGQETKQGDKTPLRIPPYSSQSTGHWNGTPRRWHSRP